MAATPQPAHQVRNILQNSEWPLYVEEIYSQVREFIPATPEDSFYSPLRTYVDGQRLYHPAEQYRAWFTVRVDSPNKIKANFDDGRVVLLVQGCTNESYFSEEIRVQNADPEISA